METPTQTGLPTGAVVVHIDGGGVPQIVECLNFTQTSRHVESIDPRAVAFQRARRICVAKLQRSTQWRPVSHGSIDGCTGVEQHLSQLGLQAGAMRPDTAYQQVHRCLVNAAGIRLAGAVDIGTEFQQQATDLYSIRRSTLQVVLDAIDGDVVQQLDTMGFRRTLVDESWIRGQHQPERVDVAIDNSQNRPQEECGTAIAGLGVGLQFWPAVIAVFPSYDKLGIRQLQL